MLPLHATEVSISSYIEFRQFGKADNIVLITSPPLKFIQHLFCSLVFDVVYSVQRIGFIYKADKAMPLNRSEKVKLLLEGKRRRLKSQPGKKKSGCKGAK